MIKSGLWKRLAAVAAMLPLCATLYSFHPADSEEQLISWSNKCLLHWFSPEPDAKLKKWELNVTADCFLRFKKYHKAGKQEYYSFHLKRFKDVDYLGTTANGMLCLTTMADDIIVQTYNDPNGNVDSMSTTVRIPVHDVEPGQLDSLRMALLKLKDKAVQR